MKKTLLLLVIALAPIAAAARVASASEQAVMTVAGVGKSCGEHPIVIGGTVEKHPKQDKYQFIDQTGKVVVEIDGDDWRDAGARPNGAVMLFGETDGDCPGNMTAAAGPIRIIT
ncbi:MAG: NirD/YgiW/YdeI family stress tolerance protein [Proteobacteria bacterium]|nr:NirD/YgiW/YdeI family stress tolerance protein [Pseudomonadota bacterium]